MYYETTQKLEKLRMFITRSGGITSFRFNGVSWDISGISNENSSSRPIIGSGSIHQSALTSSWRGYLQVEHSSWSCSTAQSLSQNAGGSEDRCRWNSDRVEERHTICFSKQPDRQWLKYSCEHIFRTNVYFKQLQMPGIRIDTIWKPISR